MTLKEGDLLLGTVVRVYPAYALLLFSDGRTGLLHAREAGKGYGVAFTRAIQVGNIYKVKAIAVDPLRNSLKVSLKRLTPAERRSPFPNEKVDPATVSFAGLAKRLPGWIQEENSKDI